jgi:arginase family enzyme
MRGRNAPRTRCARAASSIVWKQAGLVYFDGDADLATPGQGSGILDAMGIAHLLGLAETELTGLFATRPPLAPRRLAMPALSAVVLTEVNPSYDPAGDSLDRYLEAVTGALVDGLAGDDG